MRNDEHQAGGVLQKRVRHRADSHAVPLAVASSGAGDDRVGTGCLGEQHRGRRSVEDAGTTRLPVRQDLSQYGLGLGPGLERLRAGPDEREPWLVGRR
ncbi:hypothetical protein ABIA35_001318 [Catenulispora sp. MAP12-49]